MSHMDPVSGLLSSNSIRGERLKPEIEPKADCRCSIAVRCNSEMGRIRHVRETAVTAAFVILLEWDLFAPLSATTRMLYNREPTKTCT